MTLRQTLHLHGLEAFNPDGTRKQTLLQQFTRRCLTGQGNQEIRIWLKSLNLPEFKPPYGNLPGVRQIANLRKAENLPPASAGGKRAARGKDHIPHLRTSR